MMFKAYKDKKNIDSFGKNPHNYENVRDKIYVYEQKLIKIGEFNRAEQKEVKEWVEKQKIKRREMTEKNKLLKKKKNTRGK